MELTKRNLMIVTVFLWSMPTSVLFAVWLTVIQSNPSFETLKFSEEIFYQLLTICIPVFVLLGSILGMILSRMLDRYSSHIH